MLTRTSRPRRRHTALLAALVVVLAGLIPASAATGQSASTLSYSGTLPSGTSWVAHVPAQWNGVLVLYSHGFGPPVAADAFNEPMRQAFLNKGYALVGSSYDPDGSWWALETAVKDQFESLRAAKKVIGQPRQTLALGTSMGGLVSSQEAERARRGFGFRKVVDGVVSTCGLVGGGVDLNNYQLDAEFALHRLLAPEQDIKLVGYASPAEGSAAATQLAQVAQAAAATPQGRARVALGAALMNMPTWSVATNSLPTDAAGLAAAQTQWLMGALPFVMSARYWIELSAGGNASWNAGVNYAKVFARSPYRAHVEQVYRDAGLDLATDLATLTRDADIRPDPEALVALRRSSTLTGRLDVPNLTLHTLYDQLAPVEFQHRYAEQVRDARRGALLRQAYVNRPGHCAFTPSELLAAVEAVRHRVDTGRWDQTTNPEQLQAAATGTGLNDGPAFVPFSPGPLASHRFWLKGIAAAG